MQRSEGTDAATSTQLPHFPDLGVQCAMCRSLSQAFEPYSLGESSTRITNFPYAACDNDEGHSPLRLGPPPNGTTASTALPDGSATYCWGVSQVLGTQCDTTLGSCCKQSLSAVYFEISGYGDMGLLQSNHMHNLARMGSRLPLPVSW